MHPRRKMDDHVDSLEGVAPRCLWTDLAHGDCLGEIGGHVPNGQPAADLPVSEVPAQMTANEAFRPRDQNLRAHGRRAPACWTIAMEIWPQINSTGEQREPARLLLRPQPYRGAPGSWHNILSCAGRPLPRSPAPNGAAHARTTSNTAPEPPRWLLSNLERQGIALFHLLLANAMGVVMDAIL